MVGILPDVLSRVALIQPVLTNPFHRDGYVGTVEWGVGRALVEALTEHVPTRIASPFADHRRHRGVVWLEPRVVAEVTYAEMVNGWLRDPVLRQVVAPVVAHSR